MKSYSLEPIRLLIVAAAGLLTASAHGAVSETIAAGTIDHTDQIGGPTTVMMRTLTIAPGEVLGWHYHPGVGAYTIVKAGTLNVEDGCGEELIYTAGQAFHEPPGRVHRGKNLTGEPVITAQTFLVPAGSPTSVSPGQQLCGTPVEVAECKGAGWQSFTHPRSFFSQGDCEQFVITGR